MRTLKLRSFIEAVLSNPDVALGHPDCRLGPPESRGSLSKNTLHTRT